MNAGRYRIKSVCFLLLLMIADGWAISALAQDGAIHVGTNVYAAKFICGKSSGDDDVVRGTYATSINIHNPQMTAVSFDKKIIVANREGDRPEQISAAKTDVLAPGQAIRVDCQVIAGFLTDPPPHFEGFVEIIVFLAEENSVIFLPTINVVGNYTARPSSGEVSSLEVVVYTPTHFE
jgi:hypothetical protein